MTQLDSLRTIELQLLFGALRDAVLISDQNRRLEFLNWKPYQNESDRG